MLMILSVIISKVNTMIPQGSMFYRAAVVSREESPDSYVEELEKGETLYYLPVNMVNSYANSILPGSYI